MPRGSRPPPLLRHALLLVCAWLVALGAAAAPALEDGIAERTKACTFCHGEQGRAGPDGYYPRLAGKPAGYLYNQLLNFRDGRRHYGLMTHMVDMLSDVYLMEIAQYFAALDLPYAPPAAPAATLPAPLLELGRELALHGNPSLRLPACAQCHGEPLTGTLPDVPGLLGLPPDYLVAQLGGWRTGQRRAHEPDCMASVVQRLSNRDVQAVVGWLALQPVPADARPAAQPPAVPANGTDLKCGSAPPPAGARP